MNIFAMTLQQYLEAASALALQIAEAEGFNVAGSLPHRIHNPGDMELGNRGWGVFERKTIYLKADWNAELDDKTDGASALRRECLAMLVGSSHDYFPSSTFEQLSVKWTGNQNASGWCYAVCKGLGGIESTKTLEEWVELLF